MLTSNYSSRDRRKASTIRWNGIQPILEEGCADTLVIMDAAYFPTSKVVRKRGVLEILSASISEDCMTSIGRCVFTRSLSENLKTRAARERPLSVAELHAYIFAQYSQIVRDKHPEKEALTAFPAPLHILASANSRLPSIFIAPLSLRSPMRSSLSYENSPQLHLSIRLADDNVDTDSWNEWLRLMPEGIKDIKVEGPFRSSFR